MKVNEIFYSLQAEGALSGTPVVFVRLSGCNLKCDFCDTSHDTFTEMTIEQVIEQVNKISDKRVPIIFTGGEPLLQLSPLMARMFKRQTGRTIGLETNGTISTYFIRPVIDYISVSPKVDAQVLCLNVLNGEADELRFPLAEGETPPEIKDLPISDNYFVSPKFDGTEKVQKNIDWCIRWCLEHPRWRLSTQIHKIFNFD